MLILAASGWIAFDAQQTYRDRVTRDQRLQEVGGALEGESLELQRAAEAYVNQGDAGSLESVLHVEKEWRGPDGSIATLLALPLAAEKRELARQVARGFYNQKQITLRAVALAASARLPGNDAVAQRLAAEYFAEEDVRGSESERLSQAARLVASAGSRQLDLETRASLAHLRELVLQEGRAVRRSANLSLFFTTLVLLLCGLLLPIAFWMELRRRQRAEARLRALNRVAEQLSGAANRHEAGALLAGVLRELVGWDHCAVDLAAPDTAGLSRVFYEGPDADTSDAAAAIAEAPLAGGDVAVHAFDLAGGSESSRLLAAQEPWLSGASSALRISLRTTSARIGVVTMALTGKRRYSPQDEDTLRRIAQFCTAGLDRVRLTESLKSTLDRYRLLADSNQDGVFVVQGSLIVYCNRAFAHMFGYHQAESLTGTKRLADLIYSRDRHLLEELAERQSTLLGGVTPITVQAMRRDGSPIRVEIQGASIEYAGAPGLLGTARDVSEREAAEARLRDTHDIYRQAIQAMGALPYFLDWQTRTYNFFDSDVGGLTGFSSGELTAEVFASQIKEFVPLGDHAGMDVEEYRAAIRQRHSGTIRIDYHFERKDGRLIWLADASSLQYDSDGNLISALGILLDITERKRDEMRSHLFMGIGRQLSSAGTPAGAVRIIAEAADQLFEWDSCMASVYDATRDEALRLLAVDIVDGKRQDVQVREVRPPSPAMRELLEKGSLMILRRPGDEPPPGVGTYGDTSRRSASLLYAASEPVGHKRVILAFQSYRYNAYTERDLNDLKALADFCAGGLERSLYTEEVQRSEEQLRTIWNSAGSGLRLTDSEGSIRMVNPVYCHYVGRQSHELEGQPLSVVYDPALRDHVMSGYKANFRERQVDPEREVVMTLWNGLERAFGMVSTYIETNDGTMLLSIFQDRTRERALQTELRRKAAELERLATTDDLTGLANRRQFMQRLEQEFQRSARYESPLSLLVIDLDRFKTVNDRFGHPCGDMVLTRTGAILKQGSRGLDLPARLGGEEFGLIMPETDARGAQNMAERILHQIREEVYLSPDGSRFQVTCSIGIATLEGADSDHTGALFSRADQALYRAKEAGRDRISV